MRSQENATWYDNGNDFPYPMRDWREEGLRRRGHGMLETRRMGKSRII